MFGLVKCLWYFARQHRVHCADYNQNDGIEECNHVGSVDVRIADEHIILACRMMVHGVRRCNHHPNAINKNLQGRKSHRERSLVKGKPKAILVVCKYVNIILMAKKSAIVLMNGAAEHKQTKHYKKELMDAAECCCSQHKQICVKSLCVCTCMWANMRCGSVLVACNMLSAVCRNVAMQPLRCKIFCRILAHLLYALAAIVTDIVLTCMKIRNEQITNCDLGLMKEGRFADCLPALKIRAMRLVLVSRAA